MSDLSPLAVLVPDGVRITDPVSKRQLDYSFPAANRLQADIRQALVEAHITMRDAAGPDNLDDSRHRIEQARLTLAHYLDREDERGSFSAQSHSDLYYAARQLLAALAAGSN